MNTSAATQITSTDLNITTDEANLRYFRVSTSTEAKGPDGKNIWRNRFFDTKEESDKYAVAETAKPDAITVIVERVIDLEPLTVDGQDRVKVLIQKVTWGRRRNTWVRAKDTTKVMYPKAPHATESTEPKTQHPDLDPSAMF